MIRSSSHSPQRRKGEPRCGKLARCTLVGLALFVAQIFAFDIAESAENKTNHYRQWAFIQLNDIDQFDCLDRLWFKESRWNPKARNGSHIGIPQGKSKYLLKVDGFKQVEWGLRYIENRYITPCLALVHHNRKGWY